MLGQALFTLRMATDNVAQGIALHRISYGRKRTQSFSKPRDFMMNSPPSPSASFGMDLMRCITVDYNREVMKLVASGKMEEGSRNSKSIHSGISLHKGQPSIAGASVFDPFLTSLDYVDGADFSDIGGDLFT